MQPALSPYPPQTTIYCHTAYHDPYPHHISSLPLPHNALSPFSPQDLAIQAAMTPSLSLRDHAMSPYPLSQRAHNGLTYPLTPGILAITRSYHTASHDSSTHEIILLYSIHVSLPLSLYPSAHETLQYGIP